MGKIIAIGGGEITNKVTLEIDKFIVGQCEKEKPKFLFIPTASNDSEGYIESITALYTELGCLVSCLCLTKNKYTEEELYISSYDQISSMQAAEVLKL